MRLFGLDVHREFTQVAMLEQGRITHLGRVPTTPEALRAFAQTLSADDQVVLGATGNTHAIVQVLQQHAGRVVVSNPVQTRAIADAKIKTDRIDAEVLVRLLAGGWLTEVWVPDAETQALRQQVAHRVRLVRHQHSPEEPDPWHPTPESAPRLSAQRSVWQGGAAVAHGAGTPSTPPARARHRACHVAPIRVAEHRARRKRRCRDGGHKDNKAMVMSVVERGGKVRLEIADAREKDLYRELAHTFLGRNLRPDTERLVTDEHQAYQGFADADTRHETVNHARKEWARGDVHTNSIESIWSLLQGSIVGSYHKVSFKHLDAYLDELKWRFNNRKNPFLFREALRKLLHSKTSLTNS